MCLITMLWAELLRNGVELSSAVQTFLFSKIFLFDMAQAKSRIELMLRRFLQGRLTVVPYAM